MNDWHGTFDIPDPTSGPKFGSEFEGIFLLAWVNVRGRTGISDMRDYHLDETSSVAVL